VVLVSQTVEKFLPTALSGIFSPPVAAKVPGKSPGTGSPEADWLTYTELFIKTIPFTRICRVSMRLLLPCRCGWRPGRIRMAGVVRCRVQLS
jgi:hypothetical protein